MTRRLRFDMLLGNFVIDGVALNRIVKYEMCFAGYIRKVLVYTLLKRLCFCIACSRKNFKKSENYTTHATPIRATTVVKQRVTAFYILYCREMRAGHYITRIYIIVGLCVRSHFSLNIQ